MSGDEFSSDDDLKEVKFLKEKTINEVLTPWKSVKPWKPVQSTPSPLTKTFLTPHKGKYQISLNSLLNEEKLNIDIEQKDSKINKMKKIFEEGDYLDLMHKATEFELEDFDLSEGDSLVDEGLKEEHICNLKKIAGLLSYDFPDSNPGIEILGYANKKEISIDDYKFLIQYFCGEDSGEDQDDVIDFCKDLFLYGNFHCSLPEQIWKLLWKITCIEEEELSCQAYTVIINAQKSSSKTTWLPNAYDFLSMLTNFGVQINKLCTEKFPEPILNMLKNITGANDEVEFVANKKTKENIFEERLSNFIRYIKLYTNCLQNCVTTLSVKQLDCLIVVSLNLCLDKALEPAIWDISVLIGSLLDCYNEWGFQQAMQVYNLISSRNHHHHNLVELSNVIPFTMRGLHFRHAFSFLAASKILNIDISLPAKPQSITKLLNCICINENTDYYQLNSIILLVETSLFVDDITPLQKNSVCVLIDKLRILSKGIKDGGGRFLDRTKVKDSLLRFQMKINFVVHNLQTQCPLENYFEKKVKDEDDDEFSQ